MRRTITRKDAEKVLALIEKRFASWLYTEEGDLYPPTHPKIVENYDGRPGQFAIMWDGGPYEWSYYGSLMSMGYAEREPEFGIRLPIVEVPASLYHVFTEPINSYTIGIYLA